MGATRVPPIWFQPPHRGSGPANWRHGQYCRLGHCCHGCLLPTRTGGPRLWCEVLTPLGHPTAGLSWLRRLPAGPGRARDRHPLSLLTASAERDDAQHGSRPGAAFERREELIVRFGKRGFERDRLVAAGQRPPPRRVGPIGESLSCPGSQVDRSALSCQARLASPRFPSETEASGNFAATRRRPGSG